MVYYSRYYGLEALTIHFLELPKVYRQFISCEGCGQQTAKVGGLKCLCSSCGHLDKRWKRQRYDKERRALAKQARGKPRFNAVSSGDPHGLVIQLLVFKANCCNATKKCDKKDTIETCEE